MENCFVSQCQTNILQVNMSICLQKAIHLFEPSKGVQAGLKPEA